MIWLTRRVITTHRRAETHCIGFRTENTSASFLHDSTRRDGAFLLHNQRLAFEDKRDAEIPETTKQRD